MEEKLDLWTARLDALTSKVDPKVQAEHHKQIEEWRAAATITAAKLTELRTTTGDTWDAVKVEMEKLWTIIATALDQAEAAMRAKEDGARSPARAAAEPASGHPVAVHAGAAHVVGADPAPVPTIVHPIVTQAPEMLAIATQALNAGPAAAQVREGVPG